MPVQICITGAISTPTCCMHVGEAGGRFRAGHTVPRTATPHLLSALHRRQRHSKPYCACSSVRRSASGAVRRAPTQLRETSPPGHARAAAAPSSSVAGPPKVARHRGQRGASNRDCGRSIRQPGPSPVLDNALPRGALLPATPASSPPPSLPAMLRVPASPPPSKLGSGHHPPWTHPAGPPLPSASRGGRPQHRLWQWARTSDLHSMGRTEGGSAGKHASSTASAGRPTGHLRHDATERAGPCSKLCAGSHF